MIEKATDLAKELMLREKDINIAVDMTAGNGHDSKFILDELNPEILYAFDIQEDAKTSTLNLIGGKENFHFILDSHANIDQYIKEEIDLAVYNLGYLPKGDKTITTKWNSTIESLSKTLDLLSAKGKIIITIYPGHDEGKKEADYLEKYLENLDQRKYTVLKMVYMNKINNPPYVVVVGRR